ncbi:Holliday junction ATP-dependent DNA helicase RuvA [Clostridia bacterium]|nr:Holliday junction ATP-dependent DNA helicase RuvA [Clostridia bacterium]
MFYYLNGVAAHLEPSLAVIDCGGVGYACHTSMNTLSSLKINEPAKLYTFVNVREDAFDIFGFADRQELDCFRLLLNISGVGPKAALAILSVVTPERLSLAVVAGDEKQLTAASGVGKKLAQRIILELKDKLAKGMGDRDYEGFSVAQVGGAISEAQTALMVLGYSASEAGAALRGLDESLTVEDLIRQALKKVNRL